MRKPVPGPKLLVHRVQHRPPRRSMCQMNILTIHMDKVGGGHWGILETAKAKKKIIQNRKTAKKFGQNRKPHTKPSKTDTMVTSGAYRAN